MLRPKIVSPHLILFPRFALDAAGKYGVSRGPIILAKDKSSDINVLKYLLGVLNSTVGHWQIVRQSHKYQRGYAMLEVNTLLGFSIPSPAMIPPGAMNSIQQAVDRLIREPSDEETLRVLNLLVAEMYGVSIEDLQEIVLGAGNNAGANESEQDHRKQSD